MRRTVNVCYQPVPLKFLTVKPDRYFVFPVISYHRTLLINALTLFVLKKFVSTKIKLLSNIANRYTCNYVLFDKFSFLMI